MVVSLFAATAQAPLIFEDKGGVDDAIAGLGKNPGGDLRRRLSRVEGRTGRARAGDAIPPARSPPRGRRSRLDSACNSHAPVRGLPGGRLADSGSQRRSPRRSRLRDLLSRPRKRGHRPGRKRDPPRLLRRRLRDRGSSGGVRAPRDRPPPSSPGRRRQAGGTRREGPDRRVVGGRDRGPRLWIPRDGGGHRPARGQDRGTQRRHAPGARQPRAGAHHGPA